MNERDRNARLLRAAIGFEGPVSPTRSDWKEWLALAREQRVLPLLHAVVANDEADITDAQRARISRMQTDVMMTMVRFEHDLLEVAGVLDEGRVQVVVLKGLATAHLDYADASLRQFGDVDLLVAPVDLERASELVACRGWHQAYPLPRGHRRFTHAITLRNATRAEVDLHQHISHRALGALIPTHVLLADSVEFEIGGRPLRALSPTDRLIHASVHAVASRGPFRRLSSTADVLVLAESTPKSPSEVLGRAESFRVRPLVERAIASAYSEAQIELPTAWVAAMASPIVRRDRLVERAYSAKRRRPVVEELAYLRLMHSWSDRLAYLGGYFATDTDYASRNQRSGVVAQTRYLWSRLRSR